MSKRHNASNLLTSSFTKHLEKMNTSAFYDLLNGPELSATFNDFESEQRNRVYTPAVTTSMFISQSLSKDCSCQKVVNDLVIKRMASGFSTISSNTGAYCQARKSLSTDLVAALTEAISKQMNGHTQLRWKLKGRNSLVVDGTTILMPDTEENQIAFPQQANQKEGLGFPICRMVALTSLESGALVDAAISPYSGKQTGESSLLRKMMNSLNKDDIILGDAIYSTYYILNELMDRGVDFLFEQHGSRQRMVNFKSGKKLGAKDHIIKLDKPKIKPDWMTKEAFDNSPPFLLIREFKAGGKVLITSMLCSKDMPKKLLSNHYKKRWSVELDIRNMKTTMGMEMLSCKTPDMVVKEVSIYLLAFNIIRLLILQSALYNHVQPREISFKHCTQLWLSWCQQDALTGIEQNTEILILMAQQRAGQRPGRVEPRAIKRRPKAYRLLMKKRQEAKADKREYGHPKKSK